MKVRAITGRTATTLEVQGVIDGPVPWPSTLAGNRGSAAFIVDLGAVPYVTIDGIAAWAKSLRTLGEPVYVSRVRPAVLALLGMDSALLDGLTLVTFYCPYVCSSCKTPFERLADLRVDAATVRAGSPPWHVCPSCGAPGIFDDDPKMLLAPAAAQGEPRLPEGVDALIEGKPEVSTATLSVELDVELGKGGTVTALWLAGTLQRSRPLLRVAPGLRGPLVVVAADITGTTGDGLDSLRELLMNVEGEVVLARVSAQLAQGLATTLHGTGRAEVISGRLPFACEACSKVVVVDVEIEAVKRGSPSSCPACKGLLRPKFGDREILTLTSLPSTRGSDDVRAYLGRHPHPPSIDRSAEWTNALGMPTGSLSGGIHGAPTAQVRAVEPDSLNETSPRRAQRSPTLIDSARREVTAASSDVGPRRRSTLAGSDEDLFVDGPSHLDTAPQRQLHRPGLTTPASDEAVAAVDDPTLGFAGVAPTAPADGAASAAPSAQGSLGVTAGRPAVGGKPPTQPSLFASSGMSSAASTSSAKGHAAGGRYEILRRLGAGGMAETLLGRHVGLGGFEKRVVIKRILPALAGQPAFVEMFLHEARIAARINHSNVVQIFDFGRVDDDYYIVMEYVRGWDLSSLIRAANRVGKPVPIEIACRITAELCAGLNAAHTALDETGTPNPIIHRDVSPHNVLLSVDGAVKLSDFGIAKTSHGAMASNATDPGSVKGKVAYLAPEVISGAPLSTKLDIYALGLTLYTALVGKNPYQRKGDIQTMYAVAQEPLPNIITQRRDVPFQLAAIIGRAVNRDPGQRFPTSQMFQLHLESFLSEIERHQPSTPMHVALWVTELAKEAHHHHGGLKLDQDMTPSAPEVLEVGTMVTPHRDVTQQGAGAGMPTVESEDKTLVRAQKP